MAVVLSTRLTLIIADIMVLILTWLKTYHANKDAIQLGIRSPLSTLIYRDGQYFAILSGQFLMLISVS